MITTRRLVLVLVASLLAAACKREPGGAAPSATPAAALPAATPAMFAHVPADTPYLFGMLAPVPRPYWDWMGSVFGRDADAIIDRALAQTPDTPDQKLVRAVMRELRGNLNAAGIRKLAGVDPGARAVVYGLGVLPVVRVELADPAALPATIERIAKEAGVTVDKATQGGRSYYLHGEGPLLLVAAVADGQLVLSIGPHDLIEKAVPHILGLEKPSSPMTDAGVLRKVMAQHGYGPWAGYLDVERLAAVISASNAACAGPLAAAARRVPRLSVGYDDWTARRVSGHMVLETDAQLAARLAGLSVDVPGLAAGPPEGRPLVAVGAGVNLEAGRALAADAAETVGRLAEACGQTGLAQGARELAGPLQTPLPPLVARVRGGLLVVLDAKLGQSGLAGLDAYGLVAAEQPGALLDELQKLLPIPNLDKLARDGKLHEVMAAGAIPGLPAVQAAVTPSAIFAAAGDRGVDGARRVMAGKPGKAPLFLFAYDYGRIMGLITSSVPPGQDQEMEFLKRFGGSMGSIAMWGYPSKQGLEIAMTLDLNPAP